MKGYPKVWIFGFGEFDVWDLSNRKLGLRFDVWIFDFGSLGFWDFGMF